MKISRLKEIIREEMQALSEDGATFEEGNDAEAVLRGAGVWDQYKHLPEVDQIDICKRLRQPPKKKEDWSETNESARADLDYFKKASEAQSILKTLGVWEKYKHYPTQEQIKLAAKLSKSMTEGFMGYDHWIDSDDSSDLMGALARVVGLESYYKPTDFDPLREKRLTSKEAKNIKVVIMKALQDKGDEFNPSGAVSIGMIAHSSKMLHILNKQGAGISGLMKLTIKKISEDPSLEWSGDSIWVKRWSRALKSVK